MKKLLTITSLAALVMAGVTQMAFGQTEQTDELLSLNFNLTVITQGGTSTNKNTVTTSVKSQTVNSTNIIQAIGTSIGQPFSSNAGLFILTPTNNLDAWTVQIRDGTTAVDVSPFFSHQPGGNISNTSFNMKTSSSSEVDYSIDGFLVQDEAGFPSLGLHMNLVGLTLTSSKTTVTNGVVSSIVDKINATVSGTGDLAGVPAVMHGTISAAGLGQEVVIIGPVGN